jgi:hypothetical protein
VATVFISYKLEDRKLATAVSDKLQAAGHTIRIDTTALVVGSSWRDTLMKALMDSDALVAILTPRSLQSQFVIAEVGAARAFGQTEKRMALFPLLVGDVEIPPFIQDLYVFRMRNPDTDLALACQDLDRAISQHVRPRDERLTESPRLFVSHRHKDEAIARALVTTLQSAFDITRADIRCTSVQPFRLPVGERTPDRLRTELRRAEAVLGIIAPDTVDSSYVLFELGAAWSNGLLTCPLLVRGATGINIPDPIRDLNPLVLSDRRDCQQLLDDLADATSLKRKERVGGQVQEKIETLIEAANVLSNRASVQSPNRTGKKR